MLQLAEYNNNIQITKINVYLKRKIDRIDLQSYIIKYIFHTEDINDKYILKLNIICPHKICLY